MFINFWSFRSFCGCFGDQTRGLAKLWTPGRSVRIEVTDIPKSIWFVPSSAIRVRFQTGAFLNKTLQETLYKLFPLLFHIESLRLELFVTQPNTNWEEALVGALENLFSWEILALEEVMCWPVSFRKSRLSEVLILERAEKQIAFRKVLLLVQTCNFGLFSLVFVEIYFTPAKTRSNPWKIKRVSVCAQDLNPEEKQFTSRVSRTLAWAGGSDDSEDDDLPDATRYQVTTTWKNWFWWLVTADI